MWACVDVGQTRVRHLRARSPPNRRPLSPSDTVGLMRCSVSILTSSCSGQRRRRDGGLQEAEQVTDRGVADGWAWQAPPCSGSVRSHCGWERMPSNGLRNYKKVLTIQMLRLAAIPHQAGWSCAAGVPPGFASRQSGHAARSCDFACWFRSRLSHKRSWNGKTSTLHTGSSRAAIPPIAADPVAAYITPKATPACRPV